MNSTEVSPNITVNHNILTSTANIYKLPLSLGIVNIALVFVGILGNCLTIIVQIQSKSKLRPTMIYFVALAVSDIVILVSNALIPVCSDLLHNIPSLPYPLCLVELWIAYSSVQVSSCLLAIISIERLICVALPHKVKIICHRSSAKAIVCSVYVALYTFNSHFILSPLFAISIFVDEICLVQANSSTYSKFLKGIYPLVDICVFFAVPFLTINTANTVIMYKLYKRRKTHPRCIKYTAPRTVRTTT